MTKKKQKKVRASPRIFWTCARPEGSIRQNKRKEKLEKAINREMKGDY